MSLLARVPAWVWLVLLLGGALAVQDWRHRRDLAGLQVQIDDRATQAIDDARALVNIDLQGLARATESAKTAVLAAGVKADKAAAQSRLLDAALARSEGERGRLAAPLRVGECARLAEIVERAKAAGYDVRPEPC